MVVSLIMVNTPKKYKNALSFTQVSSLAQYVEWVNKISKGNMLFRGMANVDWRVKSSLYRRLEFNLVEDMNIDTGSILFLDMTKRLLDDARHEGHGKDLYDLELLTDLQHYGAATCLIDFTKHSLIALCFACETAYKKNGKVANGKVVAFNSNDDSYNEISIEESEEKIDHWLLSHRLCILPPKKLNKRITYQQSVFVFGRPTLSDETFHICEIENKEGILEELKKNGISAGMLFDDFVGFSALHSHNKKYENWDTDSNFVSIIIRLLKGEFESAIDYCNKEIKSSINDYRAYFHRGFANSALNENSKAIKDFNKVIELNPKYYVAHYMRGFANYKLKNFKEAIKDFDATIKLNSKYYRVHSIRGFTNDALKNFKESVIDYNNAIKLNPKEYIAHLMRGFANDELKNFKESVIDYNNVIKLNPKEYIAHKNRGLAKLNLGDKKGASSDFIKAKELNPKFKIPDLS